MPGPGLITDYLAELSRYLPADIVDELADGLDQTHLKYLQQRLSPDTAARAAVAEFGDPRAIAAAFTHASPARHAARRLLVIGPAAGMCWGAALLAGRAWTWPVPAAARVAFGAALITVIGLLAIAALARHYRPARCASVAGCLGIAALDTTLLTAVAVIGSAPAWPLIVAMAASAARITFTIRILRPVLVS